MSIIESAEALVHGATEQIVASHRSRHTLLDLIQKSQKTIEQSRTLVKRLDDLLAKVDVKR